MCADCVDKEVREKKKLTSPDHRKKGKMEEDG